MNGTLDETLEQLHEDAIAAAANHVIGSLEFDVPCQFHLREYSVEIPATHVLVCTTCRHTDLRCAECVRWFRDRPHVQVSCEGCESWGCAHLIFRIIPIGAHA